MFLKVNYDVENLSGNKVLSERGKECFANYTKHYIDGFPRHKVIFYIPELITSLIRHNCLGMFVGIDQRYPLLFTVDQINEFAAWLNEFNIAVTVGPSLELPIVSNGMINETGRETEIVHQYIIDLSACKNIAEAKFALFFSRYIHSHDGSKVLVKAFEFSATYPELSHWDCLMLAELVICKLTPLRLIYNEYMMFSRCFETFKYFDFDTYQSKVLKGNSIDENYLKTAFFPMIQHSAHTRVNRYLINYFQDNPDPIKLLNHWKEFDWDHWEESFLNKTLDERWLHSYKN